MSLGIVGIYVGNVFIQTKNRPLYVIRQVLNKNSDIKKDTIINSISISKSIM